MNSESASARLPHRLKYGLHHAGAAGQFHLVLWLIAPMSSRDDILAAVRRHLPEASPLPELTGPWIEYPDPIAQFASVLGMIGGRCVRVSNVEAINRELDALPACAAARQTISRVPGAGASTVDLDAIDDPHALEDIDFALLPGEFAVAENAAVWVHDRRLKHRVIYFLCQHLAFVVSAADVVHNMHQGYERLSFSEPGFGGFIAGPSKTADIEQSLVIGAHGPRSLTVFVVGP
jgi:L-lactate dehydrogenase complex protein LldG